MEWFGETMFHAAKTSGRDTRLMCFQISSPTGKHQKKALA